MGSNRSLVRRVASRLREGAQSLVEPAPPDPPAKRLYLQRVPKCAGTSLADAIQRCYTGSAHGPHPRVAQLDAPASSRAAAILGENELDFNRKLLLYYLGRPGTLFLHGHFTFDETAYREFRHEWVWGTVLRDPVDKWFSLFFYNRYKKSQYFKIDQDLPEFVDTETAVGWGRDYVMQFAREHPGSDDAAPEAIALARRNLARFELLGVIEQTERFLGDFEALFGRRLVVERARESPVSREFREAQITDEIREKVRALNAPNYEVYDYVVGELLAGRPSGTVAHDAEVQPVAGARTSEGPV